MRLAVLHVGDEADAAGIMFLRRIVKTLGAWGQRIGALRDGSRSPELSEAFFRWVSAFISRLPGDVAVLWATVVPILKTYRGQETLRRAQRDKRHASDFFRSVFVVRYDNVGPRILLNCSPRRPRSFAKWSAKLSYLRTMPEMNARHKREDTDFLRPDLPGAVSNCQGAEFEAVSPSRALLQKRVGARRQDEFCERQQCRSGAEKFSRRSRASSRVNAPAYGADDYTARATAKLSEVFETKAAGLPRGDRNGRECACARVVAKPWEAVFCHEESHIHDDECGAPEFFTGGAKLVGIAGEGGKITPTGLREALERFPRGLVKSFQPGALSLSQATEAGTTYRVERDRGALRHRPLGGHRRAYGRGALRQRAGGERRVGGRNDMARRN